MLLEVENISVNLKYCYGEFLRVDREIQRSTTGRFH